MTTACFVWPDRVRLESGSRFLDLSMFELQKYLIFLLMICPFMVVHSDSFKESAGLKADLPDFTQQAAKNSKQIRWVEDFESNMAKPSPFTRSRLF